MSPKNFMIESIRHHVLRALDRVRHDAPAGERDTWRLVSETLVISRGSDGRLISSWTKPRAGRIRVDLGEFSLYRRGDLPRVEETDDPVRDNELAANVVVSEIAKDLGLDIVSSGEGRFKREEEFHDEWAASVRPEEVMVKESFEACTAPENRFIVKILGDIRGKRVLDLGSGLGEASVYFALKGADVTVCDLSTGMLQMASRVAAHHGVNVELHHAAAEHTGLPEATFDIVYAGNALHHVDTAGALDEIKRLLKPGGTFVSWDPVAHNPLINIYRKMATAVRTDDEHPLRMRDLDLFRARFRDVRFRCFWLLTLLIFLRFYLVERVHPSKERYWKKILTDSNRLAPLYQRLEVWDNRILQLAPWLGRYCWNIVVWGRK